MIFVEPKECVSSQEIAHFVAPEVKDEGAPILVFALPRIGMFIEMRAIKFRERVGVLWKMCRNPIHDHADAGAMTRIDEMAQLIWSSETAGRRVIVRHLITPRAFEGMLGDWE